MTLNDFQGNTKGNNHDSNRDKSPIIEIEGPLNSVVVKPVHFRQGDISSIHRHRLGQVLHPASGIVLVKTQYGIWTVPAGRGVWIPALEAHEVDFLSDAYMHSIYLDSQFTESLPKQCVAINIPKVLYELASYTANIQDSNDTENLAHSLAIVITRLTKDSLDKPLHIPVPTDKILNHIYTHLINQPSDQRTIEAWAATTGFSSRTLTRKLRQQTGMTFRRWRQQIRLVTALEKLSRNEKVTTVAYDVGYETTSAFINAFRQNFGETPKEFLKQQQRKESL